MRDDYRTRQQRRDAQDPRIMRLYAGYRPQARAKANRTGIAYAIVLAALVAYACYLLATTR